MTLLRNSLVLLMMIVITSCGSTGVKFNPDAYVGRGGYIINAKEQKVYADQPLFKEFACMHLDKWKELSELLNRATVPKRLPKRVSRPLDSVRNDAYCRVQEVIKQIEAPE